MQTLHRLAEATATDSRGDGRGITTQVPMGGGGNGNGLIPEGVAFDRRNAIGSRLRMVTPGYFEAMRIPIVKGRPLDDADRQGALKVMVISEALARAAFPDKDPIGKRIACCESGPDGKSPDFKVVVGVAGDVRSRALGDGPVPRVLPPNRSGAGRRLGLDSAHGLHRRPHDLDPLWPWRTVRDVVRTVAPGVPVFQVRTMEQRLQDSMATARFNTMLLTLLGLVGLVLAAIGVYGVIAYFVTQAHAGDRRTHGARRVTRLTCSRWSSDRLHGRWGSGSSPASVCRRLRLEY